ncbi:TetR family transcriptional regulator [Porphyrobacter algicida]|uniref:TetR family transcriptional regulator n=1 Tax=Qipengyuania algicida TaxID=1836209 RepID=A0A845AGD8_9SPHN|nr:TetR/AcrR family transcriptional regulator [Qipengyuania algicida]MXP29300.1 TetR family transcriptional regulator [Qipengyuania algicida]
MKRKNLTSDERKAATVEAVIALAASSNPADITTAQIGSYMDVTQGALFRHFPSKQEIWTAVMDWTANQLLARIDKVESDNPLDELEAMFVAHVDFVVTHPGIPPILFGELQRRGKTPAKALLQKLMAEYGVRLSTKLTRAKSAGLIACDTDIPAAAIMFLGIIQGLVMQSMMTGNSSMMREMSTRLFNIYLGGIGAKM